MVQPSCLPQIWSIEHPEWTCKIDEGSAGLVACHWSPDSRHVLTMSDFQLRITLWSLISKSVAYIKHPKLLQGGLDFSGDSKFMALAERRDCKDYISVFECSSWQLCKHFPVATDDLVGLKWSPDGQVLCIWESMLNYKVMIYSLDGRCLASYSAYEQALGIKSVTWSPTSQFLAIGSYDQKVRLLNHVTWKTVAEWSHPQSVDHSNAVVYCEVEKRQPPLRGTGDRLAAALAAGLPPPQSKYETRETPVQIASTKPDPEKPNPKMGVGTVMFSADNRYLATVNDNMPSTVWIWEVSKLKLLALLVQVAAVKSIAWDPLHSRLAVCTASNKLYLWTPEGCVSVAVRSEGPFNVSRLRWHPDGSSLLLASKTHFCVCYLTE